ncbi:hypothetical protein [Photobacterium leiognathi]|uniref:hypothetical protein n=1 Tax=Photobacterium leiognathi TaxID=553611 RepID=UPI002980B1C9|nr:hypothetical protein [Photobacterium leiognathi]
MNFEKYKQLLLTSLNTIGWPKEVEIEEYKVSRELVCNHDILSPIILAIVNQNNYDRFPDGIIPLTLKICHESPVGLEIDIDKTGDQQCGNAVILINIIDVCKSILDAVGQRDYKVITSQWRRIFLMRNSGDLIDHKQLSQIPLKEIIRKCQNQKTRSNAQ